MTNQPLTIGSAIGQKFKFTTLFGACVGFIIDWLVEGPTPGGLAAATFTGALVGSIFLGIPAALWQVFVWLINGRRMPAAAEPAPGNYAAKGAALAVPGGIIGAGGGLLLALLLWAFGWFILIFADQKTPLHDSILDPASLAMWFGLWAFAGGVFGFLASGLIGGIAGAIAGFFTSKRA